MSVAINYIPSPLNNSALLFPRTSMYSPFVSREYHCRGNLSKTEESPDLLSRANIVSPKAHWTAAGVGEYS